MENIEKKTVKNKFGITIVCCCASCQHNVGMVNEYKRRCNIEKEPVFTNYYCPKWEMKRSSAPKPKPGEVDLDMAGKGGGLVKRKDYLMFALDYATAFANKKDEMRAYYMQHNGRIFLNRK